jgi:hypothetical protein
MPGTWQSEVQNAVSPARLKLSVKTTDAAGVNPLPLPTSAAELVALERNIRQAVAQNRVRLRQLNANYSPVGQGTITGW